MKMIGAQANVGFAKESVRGTAEATATYWIPKTSVTIDDKIEQVIDESTVGVVEDSTCAGISHKFSEGELAGNVDEKNIGLFLDATFGTTTTTANNPEAGVNTHVHTVDQSVQHPSLTTFLADTVQDYKYPLTMVSSMAFEFAVGSFATYSLNHRGKSGIKGTFTPAYGTPAICGGFLPKDISVKFATNLSGLGAASATNVKNFSISIEKNVEDDLALGTDEAVDINNKQFAVTGSVELVLDTNVTAFMDDFIGDTAKAMRVSLVKTDVTIGASTNPSLTFDLAKVKFTETPRAYGNSDIATVVLSFKAFYSISDASMIKATLINTVTSY